MTRHLTGLLVSIGLLSGCADEPPPARSVTELMENPMLLEAAMVRCSADRARTRYEPECINAREAVNRIQIVEEEARRTELEAGSERKRKALRRTQQAAAEARRRAEEAERLREEAEYLAQFGATPPPDDGVEVAIPEGNLPIAIVPAAETREQQNEVYNDAPPPADGSNAPVAEPAPKDRN